MDWNWFFSSVAQSVAALVGTLLAFVIARLLNSEADFARRGDAIQEALRRAERIHDELASRNFVWYNERRMERSLNGVRYQAGVLLSEASPEEFLDQFQFSEFVPRDDILNAIRSTMKDIERESEDKKRQEAARQARRGPPYVGSRGIMTQMPDLSSFPSPTENARRQSEADAERDRLHEEREAIKRLRVETRDSVRNIRALLTAVRSNPESAQLIARVLGGATILFLLGVIYPLSFLPLSPRWTISFNPLVAVQILFSVRGFILTLATVSYLGIALVLKRVGGRLVYSADTVSELEKWTDDGTYSKYLAIWRDNEAPSDVSKR
jgi:hypothetical protein